MKLILACLRMETWSGILAFVLILKYQTALQTLEAILFC